MTEFWKQWQGSLAGGRVRILDLTASDETSAVFRGEDEGSRREVTIRLVRAEGTEAEARLDGWRAAGRLAHPNLIRLVDSGRMGPDNVGVLYAVSEAAEENLGEVLRERALDESEVWRMIGPLAEGLEYLHGKGWTHGGVKPANIFAAKDVIQLPVDGLRRDGTAVARADEAHDPREYAGGVYSPAGDVWSLGITLAEALDGKPRRAGEAWKPPEAGAESSRVLASIVQGCLTVEPSERITIEGIQRLAKDRDGRRGTPTAGARRVAVVAAVAVLAISAVVLGQRILASRPPAAAPARAEGVVVRPAAQPVPATPQPAPAPLEARVDPGPPVVKQVMPRISEASRKTIQGTLRVRARVYVDRLGMVSRVELVSQGPSAYFARAASEAARQWVFRPAAAGGSPVESTWVLAFQFTARGTTVTPTRVKP